ncbi:B-cell receptor-associated [Olea europaea subsp. europaea]|uniref:Endoplasmic reticulum transmembrane protein n=1 Tax=Olea europaea subsp. europaea TaxID=158383 RepID=A0A8S0TUB5_OLEEU|nr:B-cell receptor-associated [Olea europaea subsp. europaea]
MALQWMILAYVVAAEAGVAILLTLPSPKALKSRIVSLISLILQPSLFVVPFSAFQLLDIYWKNEHRLMCSGEICTAAERDRYEKSIYKAQRNAVLCVSACLLYWYVANNTDHLWHVW